MMYGTNAFAGGTYCQLKEKVSTVHTVHVFMTSDLYVPIFGDTNRPTITTQKGVLSTVTVCLSEDNGRLTCT